MKIHSLTLAVALTLSCTAALAAAPATPATPATPAAHAMHGMDHGKMGMAAQQTPAERQQRIDGMFSAIDTDKNGALSKAEFTKHHESMKSMHHDGMMQGHASMGQGPMGHDMKSPEHQKMAMAMFASLDTNKDGSLAKSEIPAQHPMLKHFDMLDSNKDSGVSKAEFAAHHGM